MNKVVVIGGGGAGRTAATAARKTDPRAEITLITNEKKFSIYSPCAIPFVISRNITDWKDIVLLEPDEYRKARKVELKTETKAIDIDPTTETIITEKNDEVSYDKAILATGATPIVPPIPGSDCENIFTVRTMDDGIKIDNALKQARNALVAGAGAIGLEMASAFRKRGVQTTVVELLPHVLPAILDPDVAALVKNYLTQNNVKVITGQAVQEFVGKKRAEKAVVGDFEMEIDLAILATGVRPNVDLAEKAGIKIGRTGGIKTNERLETSQRDVYAAGDCVETHNLITKKPALSQLGTTAVRTGEVAGTNAAGGNKSYPGTLNSTVTVIGDLEVGATGLTESAAEKSKINPIVGKVEGETRARYYPGRKPIYVKLIADSEGGGLVGAQIVGGERVAQRIDLVSTAIMAGISVEEFSRIETSYAPPVATVQDPLIQAAEVIAREL